MKKTTTTILTMVLLTILFIPKTYAQKQVIDVNNSLIFPCTLADLKVEGISINSVSGNSVNFTYTISNIGWSTLYLDRMYFQAYLSKDNVYDNLDTPAGGSILGNNAPALATNETYSGSWTSNAGVDLSEYNYVILQFKVRYGYSMPECRLYNNTFVKQIGCVKADLDVTSIAINSISGNSFNFTYYIKNNGWGTLYLNRMYFQAYVSQDNVYDNLDKPAGGAILGDNAPELSINGTYSGSWTSNPSVSISEYKYLILVFRERYNMSMPECNTINNTEAKLISTGLVFEGIDWSDIKFSLREENNSLLISNQGNENALTYSIYSLDGKYAGQTIMEGAFNSSTELDLAGVKPGLYVVNVTDGVERKTFKFIVE